MTMALGTRSSEALIVGGGLAGAALGIALARQGRDVTLIEANSGPHHKVCGEFLSCEALWYLERLGIDLSRLGAVPIERVRLAANHVIAEADLPFPAMSVTRRALDEALLLKAVEAGVHLHLGHRVESLDSRGDDWFARIGGEPGVSASAAFLATGKHDLRGYPRPPGKQNDLVAFKMYFRLNLTQQQALERAVELILFPGGYAGLQMVEGGVTNLCLLVERKVLRQAGGKWPSLLRHVMQSSKHLQQRLLNAEPLLTKPLALAAIPYGYLWSAAPLEGLWRLGDQAAVIPSFAGDGMSIALYSSHLAASTYLSGGSAAAFHDRLRLDLKRSVDLATMLSRLLIAAPACVQLVRLWPSLLRRIATDTRIGGKDLLGPLHAAPRWTEPYARRL